ncbi:10102_t:CDS:2, partial [Dentiscutata heterogama]
EESVDSVVALKLPRTIESRLEETIREDYSNEEILLFPICVGNKYDEKQPGFRYHLSSKFSNIKETLSVAITSLYNRLFSNSNTKFSRLYVLDKYLIQVINIGVKNNSNLIGTGIRYTSSFIEEYKKKQALFVQTVESNYSCQVAIYKFSQDSVIFLDTNLNNKWEKFKYLVEASFICARPFPNFGEWKNISLTKICKSMKEKNLNQPNPEVSTYTNPNFQWVIPTPLS